MPTLETVLILALYAMLLAWLGRKLGIIDPIMLVLGGLLLAALHAAPPLQFDPQTLMTIFLPPVLYQAAIHTSWREVKANARPILLLAIGLVIFTALAVAGVAWLMIPGLPFAAALVLGAIVSPPDAVATTAVLSKLRVPRRLVTILEGESIANDATALTLYALAVEAVVRGVLEPSDFVTSFFAVALGGMALGVMIGWVSVAAHRRLKDPLLEMMLSLIVPFTTFIIANELEVSGVIAVLAAGLVRGAYSARVVSAASRLQMLSMWNVIVFVLNAIGFLLIGLQISTITSQLSDSYSPRQLAELAFVICVTVIVVRYVWIWPATLLPRLLSRKIRARDPMPPAGEINVIGWAGMRGIVSLIAALALPTQIEPYGNFPGRDLILFLTYVVILVTLVGQGSTLGWLIRKLGVEAHSCTLAGGREARARLREAGLARLREIGDGKSETALERLGQHYEQMIARLRAPQGDDALEALIAQDSEDYRSLSRETLRAERAELMRLRKSGEIDDLLARELQQELDLHDILITTERGAG
jgi:CPA1 family monovalent cation:H+ antiporter